MNPVVNRTRGDDWRIPGTIEAGGAPVDLTGATFAAQLRLGVDARTAAATFTVEEIDLAAGRIALVLPRAVTARLAPGRYVYDIEVTLDDEVTTYGRVGVIEVGADATRGDT